MNTRLLAGLLAGCVRPDEPSVSDTGTDVSSSEEELYVDSDSLWGNVVNVCWVSPQPRHAIDVADVGRTGLRQIEGLFARHLPADEPSIVRVARKNRALAV